MSCDQLAQTQALTEEYTTAVLEGRPVSEVQAVVDRIVQEEHLKSCDLCRQYAALIFDQTLLAASTKYQPSAAEARSYYG